MICKAAGARDADRGAAVIHLEEASRGPAEMLPYLGRGEHDGNGKATLLPTIHDWWAESWSALAFARTPGLMNHM